LERAVNGRGETASYQYNGLGYRTGKTEGRSRPETIKQMEENQRSQIYLWNKCDLYFFGWE